MGKMKDLWMENYEDIFCRYQDGDLSLENVRVELRNLGIKPEDIDYHMEALVSNEGSAYSQR